MMMMEHIPETPSGMENFDLKFSSGMIRSSDSEAEVLGIEQMTVEYTACKHQNRAYRINEE